MLWYSHRSVCTHMGEFCINTILCWSLTNGRFTEKRKWLSILNSSLQGKAAGCVQTQLQRLSKLDFQGLVLIHRIRVTNWRGAWSWLFKKYPRWVWSFGSHYSWPHLVRSPHLCPWLCDARLSCSVDPASFPGNCPRAGPSLRSQVYLSSFSVNPGLSLLFPVQRCVSNGVATAALPRPTLVWGEVLRGPQPSSLPRVWLSD